MATYKDCGWYREQKKGLKCYSESRIGAVGEGKREYIFDDLKKCKNHFTPKKPDEKDKWKFIFNRGEITGAISSEEKKKCGIVHNK